MFFTNGMMLSNLLPRYPEVKVALGLSNTELGVAVAAFPAGAVLAGLASAHLVRRLGSAVVAAWFTAVSALALAAAGWAPTVLLFGAAMLVAGGADAIVDVGQNAHGMRVQRRAGRSIMNSFHATWSIGAVSGGLLAALMIRLGVPLGVHMIISGTVVTLLAFVALRYSLPGKDEPERTPGIDDVAAVGKVPTRSWILLAAFVFVATAGAFVEDIGNSWATLYLAEEIGTTNTLAALGFVTLVGAQFVGRLLGDRLVDRYGDKLVAQAGGVLAAGGMAVAVAFPSVGTTFGGFACAGFGVATLVPAAFANADSLPGLKVGTGITVVSWLMRVGFLVSPPLIGAVADAVSLRAGLLSVVVAGLVVLICADAFGAHRDKVDESEPPNVTGVESRL